jgi:hypothetical protein
VLTGFWQGRPEGRRAFGKPKRRWKDNIKMDLREFGCGGTPWIDLDQDRDRWWAVVNAVINLWIPQNAGNFLTSSSPVSFPGRTLLYGVSK